MIATMTMIHTMAGFLCLEVLPTLLPFAAGGYGPYGWLLESTRPQGIQGAPDLSAVCHRFEPMIDLGYDELTAHELLAGGLDDLVAENSHAARRMARLYAFHVLRQRDHLARKAEDPHFTLTPLQETSIEASELWGLTTGQVRRQVAVAGALVSHFPGVWDLCQTGQLDLYKASIITETASAALEDDALLARLADRITPWLVSRIPPEPSRRGLVGVTVPQLRTKLRYELAKLRPRQADERFKRAFKDRRATAHPLGDGIGLLVDRSVDDVHVPTTG